MCPVPTKLDALRFNTFRLQRRRGKSFACLAPLAAGKRRFSGRSPDLNRFAQGRFSYQANSCPRRTS